MSIAFADRALVSAALAALRVERLTLGIHDASFPGQSGEDVGRGSPYSYAAQGFIQFVAELGFTGVQLGPQGHISPINASPYDGTLFAKSPLSIALGPLASDDRWQGILSPSILATTAKRLPQGAEYRVQYNYQWQAQEFALRSAYNAFTHRRASLEAMAKRFSEFIEQQTSWLETDTLFEALARRHGTLDWERWPADGARIPDARLFSHPTDEESEGLLRRDAIIRQHAEAIEFAAFCQYLVHSQHSFLREDLARLGIKLYGDLQVGVSHRDLWRHQALFLKQYRMGAPPSRTNPLGQPWGYPVLDPESYGLIEAEVPSNHLPGLHFMRSRLEKLFSEFDGLRIDHPHGLVCPWVYRTDDPDPLHAVQQGARLFASPNLPDHPDLARFSLVAPADLAQHPKTLRYEDDWVEHLTDSQVKKHSILFDLLVDTIQACGGQVSDIACEVLSTCPSPLHAVLARHGLGRFRVAQKANPVNTLDPYRSANAAPADWMMLGTHDTPPIWRLFNDWQATHHDSKWAPYLASRLQPDVAARPLLAERLEKDPVLFKRAFCADLFVGPARNVAIFFTDLLGMQEIYNRPGEIHPDNWTLRVPPDYMSLYRARCATGDALDIPGSLALALRAQATSASPHAALIARLEEASLSPHVSLG
jgi:4-alpha-glucanotransferase